jgi:transposase-like protein
MKNHGSAQPVVKPAPYPNEEPEASKDLVVPGAQVLETRTESSEWVERPLAIKQKSAKNISRQPQLVQATATSNEERSELQSNTLYAALGKRRAHYDEAFKRSAVEHWLHSGKTARAVAAELGIRVWNLRDWKKGYGPSESSILSERIAELEAENHELRRELLMAQQQMDILKNLGHPLPGRRRRF